MDSWTYIHRFDVFYLPHYVRDMHIMFEINVIIKLSIKRAQ